jgi:hypothetical protein
MFPKVRKWLVAPALDVVQARVHLLSVGNGLEQPGDVGESISPGPLGEDQVLHVGLAFAGKGSFQIGLCHLVHRGIS